MNWWYTVVAPGGPQAHWSVWPILPPGSFHDNLLELLQIYSGTLLTVAVAMAVIVAAMKRWAWRSS